MKTPLTESIHLFLDGNRGQYLPRDFARTTRRDCISGVKPADLDYLARGPGGCDDDELPLAEGETERGEFYWATWADVLNNAVLTCPETGNKFTLFIGEGGGDLFLVPQSWEYNEDTQNYEPPESDTLQRFELPVYWASYLVNGDASGLEDGEQAQIDAWLAKEELTDWTCAEVSENQWFAHSNDATNLGGDVARYTFVKIGGAK